VLVQHIFCAIFPAHITDTHSANYNRWQQCMSNIIIFEDYKKQAEVFGKIDTPEKLTIFKKQYENYLLNVEDQNYFELSEEKLGESITDHYQQNLAPEPWFVSHHSR
jgi:hypothetical protein